ncbi:glycosyltransferase [Nannocystis pusilla]|uniref:glycosyltransferase n=1 Tax=Nannocystis pusilla TaxID=889268 RepID=UPI003B7CBDE5
MLISAICPTYARSDRHALLYEAFLHQDHADSELLVLDDSPEPSSFFLALDDPRVCYEHLPVRQSIGAKRNMLVARARGEVVVHFDDDDYYAPDYLARMAEALADDDFVTLGEWHAWQEATATMWRWDTTRVDAAHAHVSRTGYRWIEDMAAHIGGMAAYVDVDGFVESTSWGFGFSYGYRRLVWQECPFPDRNHGEDYVFSRHARTRGIGAGSCPARRGLVAASTWSTSLARRRFFRRDSFLRRNGARRWLWACCGGFGGRAV